MSDPLLEPALPPRPGSSEIFDQDDTAGSDRPSEGQVEPVPNVPLRPGRHSGWQRVILVLNILIVVACFAAMTG